MMDKKLDYKSKNELKKLLNVTDDPDVISSYLVTKTNEELSDQEFPHDDDDWAYWKTVYEHYEDETELSEQILDYIKAFLPWTDDEGMIKTLQDEFELSETEARMYLDKTNWTNLDDEPQVNPDDTVEVESFNEALKPTEIWQVQLPNGWTDVSKRYKGYYVNVVIRCNTNDSYYMLQVDCTLHGCQATLFDCSIIATKFYSHDDYANFGDMLDDVVKDFTTIINSFDDTTQVEDLSNTSLLNYLDEAANPHYHLLYQRVSSKYKGLTGRFAPDNESDYEDDGYSFIGLPITVEELTLLSNEDAVDTEDEFKDLYWEITFDTGDTWSGISGWDIKLDYDPDDISNTTQVESLFEAVNIDKVPTIDVTLGLLRSELSLFNKDTPNGTTTVVVQKLSEKKQLNILRVRIRAWWSSNMRYYADSPTQLKLLTAVIDHMKKVYKVDDTYFRYYDNLYFASADCNIKIDANDSPHPANEKRITVDYWYRIQNDYNSFWKEWSRTVSFGQAIDKDGYPSIVNPKRMGLKGGQQVTFTSKEDAVNFADNMGLSDDYKISKSKANDYLYPIETLYGPAYMTDAYYKQLTDAGKHLPIGHVNNSTEVD